MEEHMSTYYHQPPPPPPGAAAAAAHYPTYYQPQPQQQPPSPPPPGTLHLPYIATHQNQQLQVVSYPTSRSGPHYTNDQVRTLFVTGLPDDVRHREIYNLFREFPGYESSHLRTHKSKPIAFTTFVDQPSALAAMHALNGMVFDLEEGWTLHIELAKSNSRASSRSKRSRIDDGWSGLDKETRWSPVYSRGTPDSGFGSVHLPGMANSAYNTFAHPPAQSYRNADGRGTNESSAAKLGLSSSPACPTLFVANLGRSCAEEELIQVFSKCPGFLKLKMQTTYATPVAFVDFQDVASSTGALNQLQGTVLYSSPSGEGMRLEYAKSRMGKRRKPR